MDVNVFETANAGFAQALYEDFLRDPSSVPPEWRQLFESGIVGEDPPGDGSGPPAPSEAAEPSAAASTVQPETEATAPPRVSEESPGAPPAPRIDQPAAAAPAIPAGTVEIKGPGLRLATNMEESLGVPTATTFRQLPVAVLERERAALNAALTAAGRDAKVSFTHLIGWALVQAVQRHPVMGHVFRRQDGAAWRVVAEHVNLGLAVDIERKDGSRGLVVPVIKAAEALDFAAFHAAYEDLVQKARANRLLPDDFAGATVTLTNPGGLGTSASVPRLMAGQGTIVAVGSIAYPAEFAGLSKDRVTALGVAKVMTLTSTYDHRVIQGAESGEFLRTMEGLLQGQDGFYEAVFEAIQVGKTEGRKDGIAEAVLPTFRPSALPTGEAGPELGLGAAAMGLVDHFRTHGHLAARLDPLGSPPPGDPNLDPAHYGLTPDALARIPADVLRVWVPGESLAEALPNLQATYCGTLAYEFEHVSNHEERAWLREVVESGAHRRPLDRQGQRRLLERLTRVEALERFLHTTYLGHKRFSIEGLDTMIPMLDLALDVAADAGAREVVLGMAHRGRLNVLAHTVGRPYVTLFAEFEGTPKDDHGTSAEEPGTGDVKYHLGAEGAYVTSTGKAITVTLAHNPSHLEFVSPIVVGRTRAEQTQRRGREAHQDPLAAVPILIHGDAAFAAQGVVAETLNLGNLRGYATGGTVHLIANNQIGFTTDMRDARSTMYSSDLAKGFDVPIFHVNADDPEACLDAIRLAMMYRNRFHQDVVIDLVGYRRYGHNEGDEPSYTQPLMYARIKEQPPVRTRYVEQLVKREVVTETEAEAIYENAYQHLVQEHQGLKASLGAAPSAEPAPRRVVAPAEPATAVAAEVLQALDQQLLSWPEGFNIHPKLAKQFERRREAFGPEAGIEWAHAEALAFASLLSEGVPIRLTGQDTERGTFSQRHLVLHDVETGATWAPIQHLPGARAPFELHNSPLSELAALGFEYGYGVAAPEVLVVWEAQFGDFVNSAQVIVDQFLSAGLAKWGVTARLMLLLPHGYEGQGPEHSSARLERFLQLAAEQNIRIANCSTPAQYFHLLRRQALRHRIRPLVVFTPKSLLRHPRAMSNLAELSKDRFHRVLDDAWAMERPDEISRLLLCSGKVYYDLLPEAEKLTNDRPAIVRIEQLYTWPQEELRHILGRYAKLNEVVWVQEEPRNMGAWDYLDEKLVAILREGVSLRYAGRPERASPAVGYPAAHSAEQERLVAEALTPPLSLGG